MFRVGATEVGAAEALAHSLQQQFLLVRPEITLDCQKKAGHLLLQGVLDVVDDGYLGGDVGFVGLRLVDQFIELLTLLVQLLPQGLYLLPVRRETFFKELLLFRVKI